MNTMWLVCIHHPDKANAFRLAQRELSGYALAAGRELRPPDRYTRSLEKFLRQHEGCGGGFDHFTIAYDRDKDHDLPKSATLADAVHAVLRDPLGAANDG